MSGRTKENKRYKEAENYTLADVAAAVKNDYGRIDILVHS